MIHYQDKQSQIDQRRVYFKIQNPWLLPHLLKHILRILKINRHLQNPLKEKNHQVTDDAILIKTFIFKDGFN